MDSPGLRFLRWSALAFIILLLAGIALGPIGPRYPDEMHNVWHKTRGIGLLLFSYASDNDGAYPTGPSSTAVFQKLLDEKYCTDPTLFYVPMKGKRQPVPGEKLKPENVCFDLTIGVHTPAPKGLPMVFLTGYEVTYIPDGTAIARKRIPGSRALVTDSVQWPGVAVGYGDSYVHWLTGSPSADAAVVIPHFLPADFNPAGGHYQQLTPDGPL